MVVVERQRTGADIVIFKVLSFVFCWDLVICAFILRYPFFGARHHNKMYYLKRNCVDIESIRM